MPFYRFHIDAVVNSRSALARLAAIVGDRPDTFRSRPVLSFRSRPVLSTPFVGNVEGSSFRIYRYVHHKNSFLPRIRGTVTDTATGSRTEITMSVHPAPAIFIGFWLLVTGQLALLAGLSGETWIPLIMFVAGLVLVPAAFFPEAWKARKVLRETLAGPEG